MAVTVNLNVEYHQQDTRNYCGAACAQMVLNEIGAGILAQDDLYEDNHSHNSPEEQVDNWASGPTGLDWTMVNRKPDTFANTFALFHDADEETISRKIIWTIQHYSAAPIALVMGWDHWVVVTGYVASKAPTNGLDNSYAIGAFFVSNPWPPTPEDQKPPPHTDGDQCGSGGHRGIPNEFISYETWQSDYMTGAPRGNWAGQHIAICDPEPAPKSPGKRASAKKLFDGENLIDKETAATLAMQHIEQVQAHAEKLYENGLKGVHAGSAVLNQRLDKLNDYYYIVPLLGNNDAILALMSIDARFGYLRQAAFARNHTKPLVFQPLGGEEIRSRLLKLKRIELHGEKRILTIHPEAMCIYPALVWKPCKQSLSPYWPFHLITIGNHQLYLRVDGELFTELEINQPGI
jgi:hypothetical protein